MATAGSASRRSSSHWSPLSHAHAAVAPPQDPPSPRFSCAPWFAARSTCPPQSNRVVPSYSYGWALTPVPATRTRMPNTNLNLLFFFWCFRPRSSCLYARLPSLPRHQPCCSDAFSMLPQAASGTPQQAPCWMPSHTHVTGPASAPARVVLITPPRVATPTQRPPSQPPWTTSASCGASGVNRAARARATIRWHAVWQYAFVARQNTAAPLSRVHRRSGARATMCTAANGRTVSGLRTTCCFCAKRDDTHALLICLLLSRQPPKISEGCA